MHSPDKLMLLATFVNSHQLKINKKNTTLQPLVYSGHLGYKKLVLMHVSTYSGTKLCTPYTNFFLQMAKLL